MDPVSISRAFFNMSGFIRLRIRDSVMCGEKFFSFTKGWHLFSLESMSRCKVTSSGLVFSGPIQITLGYRAFGKTPSLSNEILKGALLAIVSDNTALIQGIVCSEIFPRNFKVR